MDTTIKLELKFATEEGKSRTLTVNQPAMDLDAATVQGAMEAIAATDLFEQDGIQLYKQVEGARYVTRTVDEVFETTEA